MFICFLFISLVKHGSKVVIVDIQGRSPVLKGFYRFAQYQFVEMCIYTRDKQCKKKKKKKKRKKEKQCMY